jgi:hypothetical protein
MSLQYVQVCTKLAVVESDPTQPPSCFEHGWVQAEIELSSEAAPWASGEQINELVDGVLFICAIVFIFFQIKKAIEM